MNQICRIVGAGDFDPALLPEKNPGDLLIAADAGFASLQRAGITPDLYIGDGDSLGFSPKEVRSVVLPKVKDETDTLAAIREGLSRGYRSFVLYGALGGTRFSHSLANLQALSFLAENGARGEIADPYCRVLLLLEGEYEMDLDGGYFSLFALDGEAQVSIKGAKYTLDRASLSSRFPLGVSNEGSRNTCLKIHQGQVLLVRDGDLLCPDGADSK